MPRSSNERLASAATLLDNYAKENPPQLQAGVCRHCHCTGDTCTLQNGDKCSWANDARTCCTAADCLAREGRLEPNAKPQKLLTRREAQQPCDCASCSGRARGRCRVFYIPPR